MSVPIREPLCLYCRRFNRDSENPVTCSSFPNGIPPAIWQGELSHTKPVNGEQTFLGSIPVGWEARGSDLRAEKPEPVDTESPGQVESVEPPDYSGTAAGWTPARRV
jgi:hypothetical protein